MKPKVRQDKGTIIAKMLWPALGLNAERSFWDLYGQDGELDGKTIQIKYDHSIARTGNLYHEVYEKSALNDSQQWRKSPGVADAYIFCTEDETTARGSGVRATINSHLPKWRGTHIVGVFGAA